MAKPMTRSGRSISNKRELLIYLLILAGILVLANLVSRRLFFRWDWTENNIYTLSESSRNIVGLLDDRLLAKVYFSDDLPGEYAGNRRYLQDMLEEFQAYAGGNFHFEIYRPEDDSELEAEAQKYGIPPVQLQAIENDRMEIKNVWMGLALLYQDRRETIPIIQSTVGLEYDLAAAIKKLINVNKRTIALVMDPDWNDKNRSIRELLSQTYNITTADLDSPVAGNVDLLIMNGITDSLSTTQLYHIDQYLMSGRGLFLAQSSVHADLQQGFAREIRSNLLDALRHYGLQVGPGLLADRLASQIGVETQRGIFRVRNAVEYPFFPLIRSFNGDHPITSGLEQARLFFTSQVTSALDLSRDNTLYEPLAFTSQATAYLPGPAFNISHANNPVMGMLSGPARPVAGLLRGSADSYFSGKEQPSSVEPFRSATVALQILVVGDREFFSDQAGAMVPDNLTFIINAADFLTGDAELIAVRSREVSTRPLKELSDGARRTYKWLNILGPALLVVTLGLWRWRGGRVRSRRLEETYGH